MITRRKALAVGAGSMLAAGIMPSFGAAQQQEPAEFFLAGATGAQQVPPVETNAQGGALFALNEDGSRLHYTLAVNGLENTTMAHIHRGPPGENGPVVTWLYPAPEVQAPQPLEGRFTGVLASDIVTEADLTGPLEGESLSTLIEEMTAGNTYVNVHTEEHEEGEIRGQILSLDEIVESVDQWQQTGTTATPTETPAEEETPTETPAATPQNDTGGY